MGRFGIQIATDNKPAHQRILIQNVTQLNATKNTKLVAHVNLKPVHDLKSCPHPQPFLKMDHFSLDICTSWSDVEKPIDRFLLLRIVGVCQDEKSDGGGKAGLTFQTVCDLPYSSRIIEDNGWWGDSIVRTNLQEGGELYNRLVQIKGLNEKVVKVNKYSQKTRTTDANATPEKIKTEDTYFLGSMSEIMPSENVNHDVTYIKQGGEGEQYTYYQQLGLTKEINSANHNLDEEVIPIIASTNSGATPIGSHDKVSSLRTPFASKSTKESEWKHEMYNSNGGITKSKELVITVKIGLSPKQETINVYNNAVGVFFCF